MGEAVFDLYIFSLRPNLNIVSLTRLARSWVMSPPPVFFLFTGHDARARGTRAGQYPLASPGDVLDKFSEPPARRLPVSTSRFVLRHWDPTPARESSFRRLPDVSAISPGRLGHKAQLAPSL